MKNNLKPLQEYTQKDIDLSIEDLKDCIERVDAIGQLLSSFKIERKKAKDETLVYGAYRRNTLSALSARVATHTLAHTPSHTLRTH